VMHEQIVGSDDGEDVGMAVGQHWRGIGLRRGPEAPGQAD
jgi:hypothetical protein